MRWDIRNIIFVRKAGQISYQVDFVNYRNGALDSQPQLIKLTSCLFVVDGSPLGTPASSTTKTGRHDIAKNIVKVALNTINQVKSLEPSTIKVDIFPVSLKTVHPSY